jgi:hypothetical protein
MDSEKIDFWAAVILLLAAIGTLAGWLLHTASSLGWI